MPVADKIKVDLTNVEGSMTNIIHNNADRLYSAQSVRELHSILSGIFEENSLDTAASRSLLLRVLQKRNLEQALSAVFNSYLYGAGMGRNKEKIGGRKTEMFKIDEKLKKIVSEEIEKIEVTTDDSEITVETEGEAVKVEIEPKCQGAECTEVDCTDVECDEAKLGYNFFSDLNPEIDIDDEVPTEDVESAEDEEVVGEGLFSKKKKPEQKSTSTAKARKWQVYDCWNKLVVGEYDTRPEAEESAAGRGHDGRYRVQMSESKSIKESGDINPDIWKAIGRKFDYTIAEKAAEILENLADRALMQDNVEDTYEAVTRAIDDGLFYSADIWEINALYDECQLSDNAYSCLIEDLVEIVENVKSGNLTEGIEKKYVKPLKDKINACRTKQDLDEIGAYLDDLSDKDIDRILDGKVTNKDLNKMFGGYNFVDDDFPGWDFKESKSIKESYSYSSIYEYVDSILGDCCRGERRWPKADPNDFARILEDEYNLESEEDYSWKDLCRVIHDIYPNGEYAGGELDESKSIKEALSVAEFIDWHETTNYKDNENTFEAVYSILDKYPESEDDVKAQYTAASDEDKEAISRIIDKANETAAEEPTVYLARAMHKMYVDGYNYQEIADTLGAPVSLVIKMIGSESYDESLTESTEKQYVAIDTQDKDNKDNNRKYTEKQLIDFAKELIKIEEESSEPEQYKKRPELKDDLASAKKVLKYFMYDVKEAE